MIALPIILFIATLYWDVVSDYNKWLKGGGVSHTKEAWVRCLVLLPAIIGFVVLHHSNNWQSIVYTLIMEFFLFWTLFDGFYNVIRGYDWWFTGSNESYDAKLDNLLQSIPLWLHKAIKIGGCIAGVWLYVK